MTNSKKYATFFTIALSFFTLNAYACNNNSALDKIAKGSNKPTTRCQDHFDPDHLIYNAARKLARSSLSLRALKWSRCINNVGITDNVDSDLRLIQRTLSKDEKFRFSKDIMAFKKQSSGYVKKKINDSKIETSNINKVCRSIERELEAQYKTAKKDYLDLIS